MALFSSCRTRPLFSFPKPSHKPSAIPIPPIPETLISKFPIPKIPCISVSASANRHRPVTRSLCRCCKNSDSSFEVEKSHSSRIFIKGLPFSTTEGFLAKTFSRFGTVSRVKIITEKSSKQSLGFAYVWFTCDEAAQLAVKEMDGKFVDGRFVAVTIARPESPTSQVRAMPYKF